MQKQLERMLDALAGARKALILPHNDPDPDAVASACALQYILETKLELPVQIAYEGIIGRAENRALVRYLDTPLRRFTLADLEDPEIRYLLVDTQPGAGNNPLPAEHPVAVVIDHHPPRPGDSTATFSYIAAEIGACSTLLTEFLRIIGLEPSRELATALFYGIKSDTRGLSRGASPADISAYFYLQPLIDVDALVDIEQAQVPSEYFKSLALTLQNARVYQDVIIAYIGATAYPDMAAEMADLLLRIEQIQWSICMNAFEDEMIISVRTRIPEGGAETLVEKIAAGEGTAGGHGTMAGGQIPLAGRDPLQLAELLHRRILENLNVPAERKGKPLVGKNQFKPG